MVERAKPKAASRPTKAPAKKAAPRTKGTPAKPPAPRKVAKAAAPKKAASKGGVARASAPPARPPASPAPPAGTWTPAPTEVGWEPAEPTWLPAEGPAATPAWSPAPASAPVARQPSPPRAFDLATGQWIAGPDVDAPPLDPAAYRRGTTRTILLNVLLGITLGIAGLLLLAGLVVGIVLVAAPDSQLAESMREGLDDGGSSPGFIIVNALLTFLMFGVVPFLWVLGTRVVPWRGTVKFLQLRVRWKDWLLGVALVPAMIASVWVLLVVYTCAVDGCGALGEEPEGDSALDEMLENLTWPVVIVVALCAGIGEEILFRGVLQRWLGVWGQGLAFGLAHAQNAYPPQVLFAFGLGVVFGYLYKRGWSLVTLIVAHTLYDFTLLAVALLYPELG